VTSDLPIAGQSGHRSLKRATHIYERATHVFEAPYFRACGIYDRAVVELRYDVFDTTKVFLS